MRVHAIIILLQWYVQHAMQNKGKDGGDKWRGRLQRGDISAEPDSKNNIVFLLTVS